MGSSGCKGASNVNIVPPQPDDGRAPPVCMAVSPG